MTIDAENAMDSDYTNSMVESMLQRLKGNQDGKRISDSSAAGACGAYFLLGELGKMEQAALCIQVSIMMEVYDVA
jgi:hypothetical protein